MAEKLGLSSAKYSRIENDQAALDANLIPKITQDFNVPVDKIFQEDGKVILNNPVQHIKGDGTMLQNGISENERKLYEQLIASLQSTVAAQQETITSLKAQIR
jgi:transcriptional regulator with XRE-family HTH domain